MVEILDGKIIAEEIKKELKNGVANLKDKGIIPGLAVILVGSDPASKIYVRNKIKAAEEIGINSKVFRLNEDVSEQEILDLIRKLNNDSDVHGILVQLPLPENINEKKIMKEIDYRKDVDCFHYQNIGKLSSGAGEMLPCTPAGIIEIMKRSGVTIAGKECVIVGRSNIVGKPLAMMLLHENGTVTVAHSKTKNLADVCRRADILISAVGKPGFISKDMVKPGAVVIDVGINRTAEGKIVGDVDFENVCSEAQCITPVPGGVGPMTIAMLMKNTIEAAKNLNKN